MDFRSNGFSYFFISKMSRYFLQSLESSGLSVEEKKCKIDSQDGCHGGYLEFPIRMFLAFFDLQVDQIFCTKFCLNWPFSSGEEAQNRFSRRPPS